MKRAFIALALVFLLGIASAVNETITVTGIAYNSDYSSTLDGVLLSIKCQSTEVNTVNSKPGGVYALNIMLSECPSKEVYVSADHYSGSATGTPLDIGSGNFALIINPALTYVPDQPSGGGGGGGSRRYYDCGNGKCDSGETRVTRPEDCKSIELNSPEIKQEEINEPAPLGPPKTEKNFFSTITGAVLGTFGQTGTIVLGVFVLLIVAGLIIVFIKKKK